MIRAGDGSREDWETALGRMVCGIYILTVAHGEEINGMAASWVSPVSYAPPLLMAAIHPDRRTHGLVEAAGAFALHCLPRERREWVGRFKGPDPAAKFDGLAWSTGKTGSPVLEGCPAIFECRVRHRWAPGNHTLFVGEVVVARTGGDGSVLSSLDYGGVYLGKD